MNIQHIDIEPYSDRYWEVRSGREDATIRINASSAAAFLPEGHPYITKAQAIRSSVRAWHGAESEFTGNIATDWGTEHEQQAIDWYSMEFDEEIKPCGIFLYGDLFATTPDGLIGDYGIVEIKCPFGMRHKTPADFKKLADMPHYYAQVTLEMAGTESSFARFIQWCPQGGASEGVEFDQAHYDYMEPYLIAGRDEILAELDNPAHLAPLVKELDDEAFLDLAAEYVNRERLLKAEAERQKNLKAELLAFAEGINVKGGGITITQSLRKGNVDYTKLLKEYLPDTKVDTDQFRKPSTSVQTIRIGEA